MGGTASCNLGNTTLAHGGAAAGYSSATGSCNSQSVTCNNGNLSNPIFHYDSCSTSSGSGGSCSWNWADDFAPPRPMSQRPVLRSMACSSGNEGQKQNVTDGSADWTCGCAAGSSPVVTGTASCSFGNTTLAHGATATGYSAATGSCTSQSVTCTNGNLSNPSFNLNACPSVVSTPVAAVTDYCPGSPVRLTFNASEHYRKIYSSQYAKTPPGGFFVVAIDVTATDSTVGRYLAEVGYSDFGAPPAGRYVTLSKSKCDFTEAAQWISINVGGVKHADNEGGGVISMGGAESRLYTAKLTPGRWYLNFQNAPGTCPSYASSCDVVIGWAN